MDDKKFCFIVCTNSKLYFEECIRYIQRLYVPEGYQVDVLGITDAISMTAGYNEGMIASDAKYKIYMHQDVFILYPLFLQSILEIFQQDERIGMIGMVGAEKMPADGVMWHNSRRGNLYMSRGGKMDNALVPYDEYQYLIEHGLWDVQAIDGLMMITSQNIPWRQDIFDGWDFYDASHSFEMIKAGYRVVVPEQTNPWCMHDDGRLNLKSYDKYRQKFLIEYDEFFV